LHCRRPAQQQQQQAQPSEHEPSQQEAPAGPDGRRLLCFNLFALEGYSIAEALQVPCAVLQPYLIPYSMPAAFKRRFQRCDARLAAQLHAAAAGGAVGGAGVDGADASGATDAGAQPQSHRLQLAPVSWRDVSECVCKCGCVVGRAVIAPWYA
jgi:hypothetical protein